MRLPFVPSSFSRLYCSKPGEVLGCATACASVTDPVLAYTFPAPSTAASYQSPAPTKPSGTVLCVQSSCPSVASYAMTLPCTNGWSQLDDTPMITLPFATVGLDHANTSFCVVDGICTRCFQINDPSVPFSL